MTHYIAFLPLTFVIAFSLILLTVNAGESGSGEQSKPDPAAELAQKVERMPSELLEIAKVLTDAYPAPTPWVPGGPEEKNIPTLLEQYRIIGWKDDKPLRFVLRPAGPAYEVVTRLIGRDNAELARKMWDRSAEYSFTVPIARAWDIVQAHMPFRSRQSRYHIAPALRRLQKFIKDVHAGFNPVEYCRSTIPTDPEVLDSYYNRFHSDAKGSYFPVLIGLFLDEYDPDGTLLATLRNRLREKSENPVYYLVAGILASHNPDAHQALAEHVNELDITATRLESVLEQIPLWTREGQFNVSKDLGPLTVDPLGQQMICNWLGVSPYDVNPEMFGRIGEAIGQVLGAEWQRRDGVYGRTNGWFRYLSLWACGEEAVEEAVAHARNLTLYGDEEQKRVALLYAANLPSIQWRYRVAAPIFLNSAWAENPSLAGLALDCFRRKFQQTRIVPQSVEENDETQTILYLTEAEREELYYSLKGMLEKIRSNRIGMPLEWRGGWDMERRPVPVEAVITEAISKLIARPTPQAKTNGDNDVEDNPMAKVIRRWNLPFPIPTARYKKPDYSLDKQSNGASLPRIPDLQPVDESTKVNRLRDDFARFLLDHNREHADIFVERILRDRFPDGNFTPVEREIVISLFRNAPDPALRYGGGIAFTDAEYERVEGYLINPDSPVRRAIYVKILQRDPEGLQQTLSRLIASSERRLRRAGYELTEILRRQDDPEYRQTLAAVSGSLRGNSEAEALFRIYRACLENGFGGLYNPALTGGDLAEDPKWVSAAENIKAQVAAVTLADIQAIVDDVAAILIRHAGETYPVFEFPYDKTGDAVIGPDEQLKAVAGPDSDPARARPGGRSLHWEVYLDEFPLARTWREYLHTKSPNPLALMLLGYIRGETSSMAPFSLSVRQILAGRDWFKSFRSLEKEMRVTALGPDANDPPQQITLPNGKVVSVASSPKNFPMIWVNAAEIAFLLIRELPPRERYPFARRVLEDIMDFVPDAKTSRADECAQELILWRDFAADAVKSDEELFRDYFAFLHNHMIRADALHYPVSLLRAEDLVRAWRLGILNEDALYRLLLHGGKQATLWRDLTDADWQTTFLSPELKSKAMKLAEKVFRLELERGELPTPLSGVAGNLQRIEGGDNLLALADKLDGGDDFEWLSDWKDTRNFPENIADLDSRRYSEVPVNSGRRLMLSYLLRITRPYEGEDAAAVLQPLPIDIRKEIATFAPQWRR